MHAHPGALAILAACSCLSYPGQEKAEIGCNSCFHLVDGQRPRPRTQKELFQKITVWGWNLWFDLSNKLLVLSVPLLIGPATKHHSLGQQMRTRQKNPLTLEKCGEPDSLEIWLQPLDRQNR